jgi:hypothetical protein
MFSGLRIVFMEPGPMSPGMSGSAEITVPVRGNGNALPLPVPFLADLVHGKGGNLADFPFMFSGSGLLCLHMVKGGVANGGDQPDNQDHFYIFVFHNILF